MKIIMIIIGCLIMIFLFYVVIYSIWWSINTYGLSYYEKPLSERRNIKKKIIQYGKGFNLFCKVLGLIIGDNVVKAFPRYKDMSYPASWCPKRKIVKANNYKPQSEDIFITTQMRSGTTWTQQVVYEILSRGKGDLSDQGHLSLYAVSPWIESIIAVPVEKAPLIGEKRNRIIKTHLPSYLCPYSEEAKYIYIARHPVNCCASSYDWGIELGGPLMCSIKKWIDFFCSDLFPFKPWPIHIDGYWQWAENRGNVLFLHFEEMKQDLPQVIKKMADFLEYDLTDDEVSIVAEKASFKYMSENWELFEMSPPVPYSSDQPFFKSGAIKRKSPFSDDQKEKIYNYCKEKLKHSSYPFEKCYPDI